LNLRRFEFPNPGDEFPIRTCDASFLLDADSGMHQSVRFAGLLC
jgi:hypothetical protein